MPSSILVGMGVITVSDDRIPGFCYNCGQAVILKQSTYDMMKFDPFTGERRAAPPFRSGDALECPSFKYTDDYPYGGDNGHARYSFKDGVWWSRTKPL